MLVFDIETDGLLGSVTKLHCINVIDTDTKEEFRFNDWSNYPGTSMLTMRNGSIEDGLQFLMRDEEIGGHKVIDYDIPAIQAVYPWFKPTGKVFDTLVASRLIWTDLLDKDFENVRRGKLPQSFQESGLIGNHSLAAWGGRLGFPKGEFDPENYGYTWANVPFSKDMDDYCIQDVRVTCKLLELIHDRKYSQEALDIEHAVATIISRQVRHGFLFDTAAAQRLVLTLQLKKLELEDKCRNVFAPWFVKNGKEFVPKRSSTASGYVLGAPMSKIKLMTFNPGSRDQIADRLMKLYGWVPTEFSASGKPKVDETILSSLPYPEAPILTEYLTVAKRLGQIAEGKEAWLNAVGSDGRIHGNVNTNGAVTGRMTHYSPNVAQTPRVGSPYGAECRALFIVPAGFKLVGADAEGLELRCLAHYMARFDNGSFGESVVSGTKEAGTDPHSVNKRLARLNKRDNAKTLLYALLYGAGDVKLGSIVFDDFTDEQREAFLKKQREGGNAERMLKSLGKRARDRLMEGLPAFAKLTDDVKLVAKRGYLRGLDGRLLSVRSPHAALNTLLQSAGALVMKKAQTILVQLATNAGLTQGVDYEFVATIHDEFQIEVKEEHAERVAAIARDAIRLAGEHFKFKCPLAGDSAIGRSWFETH